MDAYNFARSLKTLNGLTRCEYICKIWTSEPDRFILNPIHQMPGLNTYEATRALWRGTGLAAVRHANLDLAGFGATTRMTGSSPKADAAATTARSRQLQQGGRLD
jgi:hypothetical protein